MTQEKAPQETSQIQVKAEQAIQESNNSLLDIVTTEEKKPVKKVKKIYPPNQVSPLLNHFEDELIKRREAG